MIAFSIHLCNPDTQTCEKNNVNQNQPTELFTTYFHEEPILNSYLVFTNFLINATFLFAFYCFLLSKILIFVKTCCEELKVKLTK